MEIILKGRNVFIDKKDLHLIENFKWYFIEARQLKEKHYLAAMMKGETIYLHRVIMQAKSGEIVDHRNGNTLDFRRSNLRIVSAPMNRINCVVRQNKKSTSVKGVFKKTNGSIYSVIRFEGKKYWLGYFKTVSEAEDAYNQKRKELFPSEYKTPR